MKKFHLLKFQAHHQIFDRRKFGVGDLLKRGYLGQDQHFQGSRPTCYDEEVAQGIAAARMDHQAFRREGAYFVSP